MIRVWLAVVRRDLLLASRRRSDIANTLAFFIVVVSLVPLGVGPEAALLRSITPGMVWIAALLAAMLSLSRLFADDHADGTLEQMLLAREPLLPIVAAKATAHWLLTGLPLTLLAAPLAIVFDLGAGAGATLVAALLLGTPALSLIGAVGAALTLGLRGGGVLVSLLVLPLTVPILIFGAGAVETYAGGQSPQAHLLLLAGLTLAAAALAPWAVAAALRISME
jgi:heme exporter protein B